MTAIFMRGLMDYWINGLLRRFTHARPFIHSSKHPLIHYTKEKGAPKVQSAWWKATAYFAPRMASLAALATWNFTTRLAGIWMVSPVAGLRPRRAARFLSLSLPRPGSVKVFLAFLYARSASDSRYWTDCFFVIPTFSASVEAIWDFDSDLAIVLCVLCFSCC